MTPNEALFALIEILLDDSVLDDMTRNRLEDLAQDIFDSD